jgi:long-chain acyl-CoA synthetase
LIVGFIRYKLRVWPREDNKIIIFMPLSHPIQRGIIMLALSMKINIVLSNPKNCLNHIISEKPNIMFSIPMVYSAISENIKAKIEGFSKIQKIFFKIFNTLRINTLSNRSPIKLFFSYILFKKIKKIYGGRGDYFVTGSAPINPEVLRIFYSIGVKVFEAYGQTESTNIIGNHKNFRIGSVGKPEKDSVKINDDGELMLRYKEEEHSKNKGVLNINGDWIHSGDLAYIDKDGYLFITGRKDDVIILDNGKKVNPYTIESMILQNIEINHVLLFSKNSLTISAIIDLKVLNQDNKKKVEKIMSGLNNKLATYEQITDFCIVKEHFSTENYLLTGTFKMKRKNIIEKYKNCVFERVNTNSNCL